jgi:hypothetical protein
VRIDSSVAPETMRAKYQASGLVRLAASYGSGIPVVSARLLVFPVT